MMFKWVTAKITYILFVIASIPSLVIQYTISVLSEGYKEATETFISLSNILTNNKMVNKDDIINKQDGIIKRQMNVIEDLQELLAAEMNRNKEILDNRTK